MKLTKGFVLCLMALWVAFNALCDGALAAGKSWYVDAYVYQSGDGTSWEKAFKTIQEGINAASDGDTVTVREGTYPENIQFKGKNIVLTGTDPLDPDVVAGTLIDGGQLGSVVTFSGSEGESCILAGFTICSGKSGNYGGGIFGGYWQHHTRATIAFNVIAGNIADLDGGGVYGCDGRIRYNIITLNSAVSRGGGLCYCAGTIQGNNISLNSAESWGGGLALCDGTIQDNVVSGNTAREYGGGGLAYCAGTIHTNTISANIGKLGGGLMYCHGIVEGNRIINNSATDGGGLHKCYGTIQNNLILGNSASEAGGGLHSCGRKIRNNTIVENTAESFAGGLEGTPEEIVNCIFWRNSAPNAGQLASTTPVTYSCIENWAQGGAGNIDYNPQFVDADGADDNPLTYEDNDYRLKATSPCIDTGKNQPWMWGALDLDGNNRIFFGGKSKTVDMGTYEYNSFPFRIVEVRKTPAAQLQLKWTSRPGETYDLWSWSPLDATLWWYEATVPSQGALTSWTGSGTTPQQRFYVVELR